MKKFAVLFLVIALGIVLGCECASAQTMRYIRAWGDTAAYDLSAAALYDTVLVTTNWAQRGIHSGGQIVGCYKKAAVTTANTSVKFYTVADGTWYPLKVNPAMSATAIDSLLIATGSGTGNFAVGLTGGTLVIPQSTYCPGDSIVAIYRRCGATLGTVIVDIWYLDF